MVRRGDALSLNDGVIQLEVLSVTGNDVACKVVVGGELRSRKGLNLPGIDLGICAFTERDHECLKFAAQEGIDAVSQSFVESGADIRAVRQAAEALDDHPFIIAKIERSNALEHTDDILDAADGVMIARGDLGVEVPIERTALIQKELMRQANRRAKTVITATQMLESMTDSRRPTRAEATDVANAILMPVWVAAVSSQQQTCQNLVFSCGVYPVYEPDSPEDGDAYVRSWLERHQVTGDLVILTEGPSTRHPEAHNRMEIILESNFRSMGGISSRSLRAPNSC